MSNGWGHHACLASHGAAATVRPPMNWWQRVVPACLAWPGPRLQAAAVVAAAATVAGCAPHIGDHCNVNSDCSLQGNLQCDTSQPEGYCTLFNCMPNTCQNNATCVAVNASVPGCPYDDYMSPSRTNLNMCLESCTKDSDCRTSEGYVCRDPRDPPWNAQVVDNTIRMVCLVSPTYDAGAEPDAAPAVCSAAGPMLDGSVFPAPDGAADAGADAMEGGPVEGGAGDGAAADAGAADAPGGG